MLEMLSGTFPPVSHTFPQYSPLIFPPSIPIRHFPQVYIPIRHFPSVYIYIRHFPKYPPSDISPIISPISHLPWLLGLVKVSQLLWQWNIITVTILLLSLKQPNTTTATALPWKGMYSKGHYTLSFSLCSLIWQFKRHISCPKTSIFVASDTIAILCSLYSNFSTIKYYVKMATVSNPCVSIVTLCTYCKAVYLLYHRVYIVTQCIYNTTVYIL